MNAIVIRLSVVTLVITFLFSGCESKPINDSELTVFAGIPPVAGLAEQIGADKIVVHTLLSPGENPHTFQPSPKQMALLAESDLYLKVGLTFEERILQKFPVTQKRMTIIDLGAGIERRKLTEADEVQDHSGHSHAQTDPHIWISPPNLKLMAENLLQALLEKDPEHAADYQKNFDDYCFRVDHLHERIQEILKPLKGHKLFVFHPAFGYFADCYGLRQTAIEVSGKTPSPQRLNEIINEARAENVKVLFVQPQFDQKSARTIAEAISGSVVSLDPLARDMLSNLEAIARKISHNLE
jgi:zinc transport system substrate-binding protein